MKWVKTQYCRIVKSDGSVFDDHLYMPDDLEEVLEKVRKTDPGASAQWLWRVVTQEWRDEAE
jgi:hypothetical protein